MPIRFRVFVLTVAALTLAACAGNRGGFVPQSGAPSNAMHAETADAAKPPVKLTFTIKIPPLPAAREGLHEQFVAATTKAIQFRVYRPHSLHTVKNLLKTIALNLAPGASGCKKSAGGGRVCTEPLLLPPPAVDLAIATFDRIPKGGKIVAGALQLAADAIGSQPVAKGKTLKFTLGGIPASVTMTLPNAHLVGNIPTVSMHGVGQLDQTIELQALDADGNIILTDGYVNASGRPVSITMVVSESVSTCGSGLLQDGTGAAGLNITVPAPPANGITFSYGTTAIAKPFTTAGYCSFAITAQLGSRAPQRGSFVLLGPQLSEYPISGASEPTNITSGPDGNIWFANANPGAVGTINVSTKAITLYPVASTPQGIVSSGGNLWTDADGQVEEISTSGTVLQTYPFTDPGSQASSQLAVDPNGNFWFADGGNQVVVKMTSTGTATLYPPVTTSPKPYPEGMTAGPDGNMWFTECIGSRIERISPAGANAQEFNVPPATGAYPTFIVTGPDNNLWFTSCPGGTISMMIPTGAKAGTVTAFNAPAPGGGRAQNWGLAAGPDQAIWFADLGDKYVDRIPVNATASGQITFVPVSHSPRWITTGSDGAIWFTENDPSSSNGYIGRLVY